MDKQLEIRLENINKKYDNRYIFKDFNLNVYKGEFVGILGKSGAGKSTLLNIIGLLDQPDKGKVIIQGKENPHKERKFFFRDTLAYIFQNYALMDNETVSTNLEVALKHVKKTKKEKKTFNERSSGESWIIMFFKNKCVYFKRW